MVVSGGKQKNRPIWEIARNVSGSSALCTPSGSRSQATSNCPPRQSASAARSSPKLQTAFHRPSESGLAGALGSGVS
jgi:hypothetical protein